MYHHRTQASTIPILSVGGGGEGGADKSTVEKNNNVRGQRASVLDLALSPSFPQIKGNHNTSLSLNSEANISGCQERYLSLHLLLAGRTPNLVCQSAFPDSGKMTASQSQGMNVNYSTSITLTAIDINMDVLNNLANEN